MGRIVGLLLFTLMSAPSIAAAPIVLTFDDLDDGDAVAAHYPGVTFSNATVLTAGISLNELELPPASGLRVATDDGGPMTLAFAAPIAAFAAALTYTEAVTLTAFDSMHGIVGIAQAGFSNNLADSGDPGSQPNEWLMVSAAGISFVTITGNANGGSFVIDDVTLTPASTSTVPEPASVGLVAGGLLIGTLRTIVCRRRRRTR